jgi:hypothetical protein
MLVTNCAAALRSVDDRFHLAICVCKSRLRALSDFWKAMSFCCACSAASRVSLPSTCGTDVCSCSAFCSARLPGPDAFGRGVCLICCWSAAVICWLQVCCSVDRGAGTEKPR